MLRLLSCLEVSPPVLRTFSANCGTVGAISCWKLPPRKSQSLISKFKLTAEKGCEATGWIASGTKCCSIGARNTSLQVRTTARENSLGGLNTSMSALNFKLKTGQSFSTHFNPRRAKFRSILRWPSNCSGWMTHALDTQLPSYQTRCYSTRGLNENISATKPGGLSWDFNLSTAPLRMGVRSMASSTRDSLETAEDVAAYISQAASSILVMTGAGLSTASGIPDFRSPGTGIYDNLQKYNLPYPEAIFDIDFFMMDPRPFVALAQELYPGCKFRPNAGHHFIRLLQDANKLRRVYTQNIDGLERLSGIHGDKLLEAHGSFSSASCTLCRTAHDPERVKQSIISGPGVPTCGTRGCKGKVKPDIVFFGENLPEEFWRFEEDLHAVDLLLIIGTSLEVYPFASIAESARNVTPRVLINRNAAGTIGMRPKDCVLQGDIVETVTELARLCGWQRELGELGRNV